MGQLVVFPTSVRNEAILEAAEKQSPAVITVPVINRWVVLKTRIIAADQQADLITLAKPSPEQGQAEPSLKQGQSVSLSFRRGHRKCMCVVPMVEHYDPSQSNVLLTKWPDDLVAVQRRAYFRAPVPEGWEIPVRLWQGGRSKRRLVAIGKWPSVTGLMHDISAGGMMAEVPADANPAFEIGEPVAVEFAPLSEVGQLCLDCNFRHRLELPNGRIGLGLQFVGLEASPAGRQMLLVLGQVSAAFLRKNHRVAEKRPSKHKTWRPPVEAENTQYEPSRSAD